MSGASSATVGRMSPARVRAITPEISCFTSQESILTSTRLIALAIQYPRMAADTRERIVETSAELFRRQGYSATGVKQIVTAAKAPFGSLYHFFPGGKEELGAEAVRVSGALYAQLIPAVFDPAPDLLTGVHDFFSAAAEHLEQTGYEDACPIATVALEISSSSEVMRVACAEVFESWIA